MAFSISLHGLPGLQSRIERLYTKEMVREDLATFEKRGLRRRRKGAGGRNNTLTGRTHGNRFTLTSTLKNPRQSGKAWFNEFVRAIYPAMGKRVMAARVRKIKEQWRSK